VGVAVLDYLKSYGDPLPDVDLLDGGTGSLVLLEPMRVAKRMILLEATADGTSPGAIHGLTPRFSSEFPPILTAHDIGQHDRLDSFHLLGEMPEVVLYAISIRFPKEIGLGLSPEVAAIVPEVALRIRQEVGMG
jgi:hydrogenase maturation protease